MKFSDKLLSWTDNHRRWLFLAVFALYVAGFNGQWRVGPDSALYATIGRHIAEGRGYTHPLGLQRPVNPGTPLLFALNFRMVGYERVWFACAVVWLMALLGLALVYRLFSRHAGRPTAVLLTLMVAGALYFYMYAFELLTDMPFFVGFMLFLNGYETIQSKSARWWSSLALIVLGVLVMALFRSVVVVVFAAVGAAVVWRIVRGPHRMRHALLLIAAVGCLFVARALDPRVAGLTQAVPDEMEAVGYAKNLSRTLDRAITRNAPFLFNDVGAFAFFGIEWGSGVNVAATLVVLGLGVGLVRTNLLWGLLVAVFVLQWLIFTSDVRYFLPIQPLLMCGWWRGALWCERRLPPVWGRAALALMLGLVLVPNLIRIGRVIQRQHRTPFLAFHDKGRYEYVRDLARCLSDTTPTNALVLIEDEKTPNAVAFYCDRRVTKPRRTLRDVTKEPHIYVVGPVSDGFRKTLKSHRVTLGPELAMIPRGTKPAWRLYQAVVTSPAPLSPSASP